MTFDKQKLADLPDIDDTAPEIYETPELTDDASTVQTATHRTTSPTPSEEFDQGRHHPDTGLDGQRIDQDEARRRFESSIVDARDVNFSESLATGRRSYKVTSRRRRKRREGADRDLSDSEDETLERKLTRLKREAEEIKLELQRRQQDEGADIRDKGAEVDKGLQDGVEELSQMLNGLYGPARGEKTPAEAVLSEKLSTNLKPKTAGLFSEKSATSGPSGAPPQPSTMSSLATISDRITALESGLGLSPASATSSSTPILPTLATLASQITTLTATLSPSTTNATTTPTTSTISLDALTTRIRDLITQSETLTKSRQAATKAAIDLRQARLKASTGPTAAFPPPPSDTASKTPAEAQADLAAHQELTTKISSLYATLPRIHELSPLLPLILERLRSLQAIHNGAASAAADLEEVEMRTERMQGEIQKWREALDRVGGVMEGVEEGIKENMGVVGGLVRGVEKRVAALKDGERG